MIKSQTLEIFIFLCLAAAMGFIFAFYNFNKSNQPTSIELPVVNSFQYISPTPTVTVAPKPQISSQISPDGEEKITLTVTKNNDLSKTYTFVTSKADDTDPHTVYTATYNNDSMSIPFNTWSPDNKYVFINLNKSENSDAIVMRADGDPITSTEATISAALTFKARNIPNLYEETTGWASDILLIVNTKKPDTGEKRSYWLEIPSKAIIPLSTQF